MTTTVPGWLVLVLAVSACSEPSSTPDPSQAVDDASDPATASDDPEVQADSDPSVDPTDDGSHSDNSHTDVAPPDDSDPGHGSAGGVPCSVTNPAALDAQVLWSGSGSGAYDLNALRAAHGATGHLRPASQGELDAFLAQVGAPGLEADFSALDVVIAWYVTNASCGVHVDHARAWHDGSGNTTFDLAFLDESLGCCSACFGVGDLLEVVAFPRGAGDPTVCLDVRGGCNPGGPDYCGP